MAAQRQWGVRSEVRGRSVSACRYVERFECENVASPSDTQDHLQLDRGAARLAPSVPNDQLEQLSSV